MKPIQSIERAINILNYIATHNNDVRLIDISKDLNLNKSTLHGIISTLEQFGYINQNQISSRYSLGNSLFHLGKVYEETLSIKKIVNPYLNELVNEYDETVHLAILSNSKVLYIDKVESNHALRMTSRVGMEDPLHATAVGKAMLANIPKHSLENILYNIELTQLTDFTQTDRNKLIEELNTIKQQGFSVDLEELERGLNCIAVPIMDYSNQAIASISIVIPSVRFQKDIFQNMKESLVAVCSKISKDLGHMPR